MVQQGMLSQILPFHNEVDGGRTSWCSEAWIWWLGCYINLHLAKFPCTFQVIGRSFEDLGMNFGAAWVRPIKGKADG